MSDHEPIKDYLTTSEAAKLMAVSPDTVLKWVKAGKVESYRTLGGHFRIPAAALERLSGASSVSAPSSGSSADPPSSHQYCWEYLAAGGDIKAECRDCITFRSRARRCYELKDLPGEMGCLNLMCDTECTECEYYRLVSGQGLNVLIISDKRKLISGYDRRDKVKGLRLRFAATEYEAATVIQRFRPDFVVVDCAFGKKRTASVCDHLFSDIRIPVARIILSSKTRRIRDYCDREVFGWIRKPFNIEQLQACIQGVPTTMDKR